MLTRLGPSDSVRRLTGTFANTRLRKGTALHPILQPEARQAAAADALDTSSSPPDRMPLKCPRGSYVSPCTANMALLPRKKIALLDFMMLRHTWASEQFFYVEQDDGCFVVNPTAFAPSWMLGAARQQASAEGAPVPCGALDLHQGIDPVNGGAASGGTAQPSPPIEWDDVIPESHLYHINDAFPWILPPPDDLASHAYWSDAFKRLWPMYQQGGGVEAANVALSVDTRAHRQGVGADEQVRAPLVATQHRRVFLRTLRDIQRGEELLMHYGTQWWSQYFLAKLFVAADDAQVKHIRWIESLFSEGAASTGTRGGNTPFPLLKPCRMKRRRGGAVAASLDLADVATRAAPTSSAVVAFALRKSCQDAALFASLLRDGFQCPAGLHSYPAFQPLTPIPVDAIRQTLLHAALAQGGTNDPQLPQHAADAAPRAASGGDAPQDDDDDGGLSL